MNYAQAIAQAFEDEMRKIAEAKKEAMKASTLKTIGLLGAGAVGMEALHRANRDRQMGRAMRIQQGSY